jgi:predicted transcriptional regulator
MSQFLSPKEPNDRVKLSLFVSPQLNDMLEALAKESSGTKSDVLRKALALYEVAADARRDGNRMGVITRDRQVVTEIVGV